MQYIEISYKSDCHFANETFYENKAMVIRGQNFEYSFSQKNNAKVFVFGTPIINEKIDRERCAEMVLFNEIMLETINGEFLIIKINEESQTIEIINDRFASIPIYYSQVGNKFFASNNYTRNAEFLISCNEFNIKEEAFFMFIAFKRLIGDETYDRKTLYMNAATRLIVRESGIKKEKYWQPCYEIGNKSKKWYVEKLAAAVQKSIKCKTSDGRRFGLLLSGGIDSRMILAAMEDKIDCITLGDFRNAEYEIAHTLSKTKNCNHYFVNRSPDYYLQIINEAVEMSGCMNAYNHAHFLCLADLESKIDVLLHGHGFDYLFQGMYLPKYETNLCGFRTAYYKLRNFPRNRLCDEFINSVPFRMKSVSLNSIIKRENRVHYMDHLKGFVENQYKTAAAMTGDKYKIWQHMIVNNLSRHYTNLNLISMCKFHTQRTIAFDNDILSLHNSMPVDFQTNAYVLKKAIAFLNKALAKAKNSNTGFRMDSHPLWLMLLYKVRGMRKRLRILTDAEFKYPWYTNKSWPNQAVLIRHHSGLRQAVLGLIQSKYLYELGFLDMEKIEDIIQRHMRQDADHNDLIFLLLTIDRFLHTIDENSCTE